MKTAVFIFALFFYPLTIFGACSSYKESFIVNEVNSWDNWIELYRNPKAPPPTSLSNWSVTVCSDNKANTCETKSFNYNQYTDGSFPVITFSNGTVPANRSVEVLVKDSSGNVIDYFNIQQGNNPLSTVLQTAASECGFSSAATPCKYYYSANSGQRDIARIPDGGCSYEEYTGRGTDTKNGCNSCNISPALNTCWVEGFATPNIADNWTIIKQENFTPQVVDGRLMLTNKNGNIATGMTLGGQLPAANNFLSIEFEQNAYGGTGADGITLALSSAAITPVAGAFGGSLGYAQKCQNGVSGCSSDCTKAGGCPGFAGGWLGFGVDEYGNFSNPTEGRSGGIGQTHDSVAIRGSGSGTAGYGYIAGTGILNPGVDLTTTQNPAPGHKYRLSVNTYNAQTWVKVERDTGSGYTTLINWADATQSATSPQNFRLSLTGSTGGSTNYHSVDNFTLKAVDCGTIGHPIPPAPSSFNAWDSFRSISDRNISTKIVGKPFTLTVASLNTADTALQDFNGTVCAAIVNQSGALISGWNKLLFSSAQSALTSFTLDRAIGAYDSAGVKLSWKKNLDAACPLTGEDGAAIATDRFAVRPASFALNAPNAVAGTDFNIIFAAPAFSAAASTDYNESAGSSFDIAYAEHNSSCITGTFTPSFGSGWAFANGSKTLTTRYSEAGIIDVNISDTAKSCTSRYARVDCDDGDVSGFYTSLTDLPIGQVQRQIVVRPHHFDLNATLSNANGGTFTYLSSDLAMSARLDIGVTAKNGEGNTTRNYDQGCYAKSTLLTLPHSLVPNPLTQILYREDLSTLEGNITKSSDVTLNFPNTIFVQGAAPLTLHLNFDRSRAKPLNPFDFSILSSTLTDTDGVTGASIPAGTATFVYGRARAYDIKTDQNSVPNPVELEIYSTLPTGYVSGMPQNILNWYRNLSHDTAAEGSVLGGDDYLSTTKTGTSTTLSIDPSAAPLNGLHPIIIHNPDGILHRTVHLAVPSWLWSSLSSDYTFADGSGCAQHPCFDYQFFGTAAYTGVQSGTFEGSDITIDNAKTTLQKGVKVFR